MLVSDIKNVHLVELHGLFCFTLVPVFFNEELKMSVHVESKMETVILQFL